MAKQRISKNDQKKDQDKGITAISVQGFKSLANESPIEIRPLTILSGANSSGKSSIIQPLLLMKQTLEASYDPGPLLLNGPNVNFTSVNQFISRMQKDSNSQEFSVAIENIEYDFILKNVFSVPKNQALEIREMIIKKDKRSLHLRSDQSSEHLKNAISEFRSVKIKWPKEELKVARDWCFLDVDFESFDNIERFGLPTSQETAVARVLLSSIGLFSSIISECLYAIIHVPGLRGNPERVYPKTAIGPDFPGTFEHYVATIIADWQQKEDDRVKRLENMLIALGLTWKIFAKVVNDAQIELQVGRLSQATSADDLVSIADVGFGVSQALPVLVALLVAKPGQLVYLEQPELHLHPRAQYALAKILAETATRGVKLVVETHSALLLRMVQTLVAQRDLDPDLVKLHWFSRSDEDGTTSIQSADLSKKGAFGDWPVDFGDVELKAEGTYLDAVAGWRK